VDDLRLRHPNQSGKPGSAAHHRRLLAFVFRLVASSARSSLRGAQQMARLCIANAVTRITTVSAIVASHSVLETLGHQKFPIRRVLLKLSVSNLRRPMVARAEITACNNLGSRPVL
jgi:hypothetical protein